MSPRNVTFQLLTVALLLGVVVMANAAQTKAKRPVSKSPMMAKLSTDIHFDGVDVSGRRQSPFGASAVVENEKATPNLIDYRNDYNDRILRSKSGR
jgi:hypothetical protein